MKKKSSKRYSSGLDLAADLALIFDDLEKIETQDDLKEKFESLQGLGFSKGLMMLKSGALSGPATGTAILLARQLYMKVKVIIRSTSSLQVRLLLKKMDNPLIH